jgi:excisionase family DNA binding protein
MKLRHVILLFPILLVVVGLSDELSAQTTASGGLAGVVIDPSSAVVPDAVVEILEGRRQALRVGEVANLFSVTPQHIYKMAARWTLPSLRIAGAIRFDPQELAKWLKAKENQMIGPETHRRQSVAA